jgi:ribosomal protein L40E
MTVRLRMPASVMVAMAGIGVVAAAQVVLLVKVERASAGWAAYASAALVAALLLVGLARRSRLAWLWAGWLSLALAAAVAARLGLGLHHGELGGRAFAVAISAFVLPLLATALALRRASAYAFYDLVCPECGTRTGLGADLLFRRARCRRCGHEW